ncbi:hypothetical protein TTHERM_000185509 (macronuclear) [Tetrahymena thermophila SB210]|uniref:Uncharacterized protein n=1 Tax=Tetrahymena thermophila (strain SB210) TaxID=312017 RepID=W7XA00_TETTS|nr:hypothetical protein TTHERM_000185509 [Tetrahymena thermophila SB210]EWS76230.1 hypothetical protein TTHERM_000185509 [Tetrahymena thermophila SB210]|eukprot:XP_012651277.1 hypothetical protein TTHERM_000185509 [Tetrahymena thermophila SB210]
MPGFDAYKAPFKNNRDKQQIHNTQLQLFSRLLCFLHGYIPDQLSHQFQRPLLQNSLLAVIYKKYFLKHQEIAIQNSQSNQQSVNHSVSCSCSQKRKINIKQNNKKIQKQKNNNKKRNYYRIKHQNKQIDQKYQNKQQRNLKLNNHKIKNKYLNQLINSLKIQFISSYKQKSNSNLKQCNKQHSQNQQYKIIINQLIISNQILLKICLLQIQQNSIIKIQKIFFILKIQINNFQKITYLY